MARRSERMQHPTLRYWMLVLAALALAPGGRTLPRGSPASACCRAPCSAMNRKALAQNRGHRRVIDGERRVA
jgi:hypothetical protein